MRAELRQALDVLADLSYGEVGALALIWKFPDHDPVDAIPREQVSAVLRFGRIDAVRFPATARGVRRLVRVAHRGAAAP